MGTSLSPIHIKKIKEVTKTLILMYDGDKPGLDAMYKSVQKIYDTDLMVKVVMLPDKLDPDEYIKKYGPDKLAPYIDNNLMDRNDFLIKMGQEMYDLSKPDGVGTFLSSISQYLNKAGVSVRSYINDVIKAKFGVVSTSNQLEPNNLSFSNGATKVIPRQVATQDLEGLKKTKIDIRNRFADLIRLITIYQDYRQILNSYSKELETLREFSDYTQFKAYGFIKNLSNLGSITTLDELKLVLESKLAEVGASEDVVNYIWSSEYFYSEQLATHYRKIKNDPSSIDLDKKHENLIRLIRRITLELVNCEIRNIMLSRSNPNLLDDLEARLTELKEVKQNIINQLK
jgi:DNA primase